MRYSAICVVLLTALDACGGGLEPAPFEVGAPTTSPLTHRAAAGCHEPPDEEPCLFGEVFSDLRTNPALTLTSEVWIRSADGLDELTGLQVLHAVQRSSHTDVTTPAEALARVDQQEVRRIDFCELATGRAFVVFEYGVGDNSYGAYFLQESADVIASIHDGDILDCGVPDVE